MTPILPLRSLTLKLGLVLFGLVLGAIAIVYLAVVPQLESRLVDSKVQELDRSVVPIAKDVADTDLPQRVADFYAARLDVRVVVFASLAPGSHVVIADSRTGARSDASRDPVALRSLRTGRVASGRVERDGREFAEAAAPASSRNVVLVSAPLADAFASVGLVRRSLLIAGLIALVAAGLAGALAAWGLTRRLRRLETAAERIAGGDFAQPIVDRGTDEVGQLAAAFDAMRERLANLDRARREFIQNASHELRTPLFSLGGFLELLDDEELDERTRAEFIAETRAQVDRLTRLATDLLDLSRLDAGQLSVERRAVDLTAVACTASEEFRAVAEGSGHDLRARVDAVAPALADEQRVLQIARILLENALRHTPAGTAVEIRAALAGERAVLAVRDEGPGIPEEDREHLFQRFYRAEGGQTFGSGLGLAIASELARMMDGTLAVASGDGETVFTLSLPRSESRSISRENDAEQQLTASERA